MKSFFDTELWKWIRTVLEIAGIVAGVFILIELAKWFGL